MRIQFCEGIENKPYRQKKRQDADTWKEKLPYGVWRTDGKLVSKAVEG